MSKEQEMSEEDYLKRHLNDLDAGKNQNNFNDDTTTQKPVVEGTKVSDLQYFNFDIKKANVLLFFILYSYFR